MAGYLVGGIPTGVLVGRLHGADPRTGGSGRVGATNSFRAMGWTGGALVALGDLAKGLVMAIVTLRLTGGAALEVGTVGIATVLGQVWSVWLRGRGGRGVATSAGVAFALWPVGTLIAAIVLTAVVALTRIVSAASLTAALVVVLWVVATVRETAWVAVAAALAAVVWLSHLDNLRRLVAGTERRI